LPHQKDVNTASFFLSRAAGHSAGLHDAIANDAVYCRNCGKRLIANATGTLRNLAFSLALGFGRVDNSENLLGKFEVLREVRRLSSLEVDSSERELENLGSTALRVP
jgi:hypothetical protein